MSKLDLDEICSIDIKPVKLPSAKLSAAQEKMWRYIAAYFIRNRFSPATDEIAHYMGYASTQAVRDMLKKLEAKNYISKKTGEWRSIRVLIWPEVKA